MHLHSMGWGWKRHEIDFFSFESTTHKLMLEVYSPKGDYNGSKGVLIKELGIYSTGDTQS